MCKNLLLFFLIICSFNLLGQVPDFKLNRTFGTPINFPAGIAVDRANNMYVLDDQGINKFDPSGTLIKIFKFGSGSIALDKADNIYLSSQGGIQKFSPTGDLLLEFGSYTNSAKQPSPLAVALDEAGNIYAADSYNDRIYKFNDKGAFQFEFRIPSTPQSVYNHPIDIKVGKSGIIYILTEDSRIFKLNAAGQFLEHFWIILPNGSKMDWFNTNTLALDSNENIYVSDIRGKRIHQLTSSGKFIKSLGSGQPLSGYFDGTKFGVFITQSGDIYTTDRSHSGGSTIQIFDSSGTLKKKFGGGYESYMDIVQDYLGNYYVLSNDKGSSIKKFNSYGTLINQYGYEGKEKLLSPVSLAIDLAGNVYCLESSDSWARVQKFDSNGRLLGQFQDFGNNTQSKLFLDMAVDMQGNMYVLGYIEGCVHKISSTGKYLGKIVSRTTDGPIIWIHLPEAISIDKQGNIFVADYDGYRIQKFSPQGKVLAEFHSPDSGSGQQGGTSVEVSMDVDWEGNLYVWNNNNFIQVYNASGKFKIQQLGGRFSVDRKRTKILTAYSKIVREYLTGAVPRESEIKGKVYQDKNADCLLDAGEKPLPGIVVMAEPGPFFGISDEAGNYIIPVDSGRYTIRAVLPQELGRTITPTCPASSGPLVRVSDYGLSAMGPNLGYLVSTAAVLGVEVASNRRRRCFRNVTTIAFANTGFATAPNAKVKVELPEYVSFISANVPHTKDAKGHYVFAVGDLQPNQRGTITLLDSVSCADPNIRNLTVCTKAWITPGNTYPTPPSWNRADLSVAGKIGDDGKARFVIRNNGPGDMSDSLFFRVYQDVDLALVSKYKLAAQDSLVLRFTPTAHMVRVEVDQPEGHPLKATAGVNVEVRFRLASVLAAGPPAIAMMAFPSDDPEPEMAQDCQPIIDSFDPNDKQVVPAGLTAERYTPTNTPLRYTIRFQNTGTDVAYRVVVVDTLSADLDLGTLQVGAVSHGYRLAVTGKRKPVLIFTFDNIMLPDSTRDQAGSNGFVQFSIKPKTNLPEKAKIENYADIFFDFNEPVRTNTAVNQIYDMPLVLNAEKQLSHREVITRPVVTRFSPAQSRSGKVVTLQGRHFAPTVAGNKVTFDGVAATVVSATDSVLTVLVPANAFSGKIKVLTPDGGNQSSTDYIIFQPPSLTAVTPAEAIPGTVVTLTGTHFSSVAVQDTVTFNGVPASVLEASETTLKVVVPSGATFGKVLVRTLGGQVETSQDFMVWYPPAIANFSPGKGKVGATVVLTGEHFAEAAVRNEVQFGTIPAQVLESTSNRLLVQVPAKAPSGRIRVQTPGGAALTATDFTFILAPEVTAFSPTRANAGATITLAGRHFNADGQADTVYFNNVRAKVLEATGTLLIVQAPKGVKSGTITVAGAGGKAVADGFEVPDLVAEDAIEVYPNPTKAAITIKWFKADFTVESLRIYNAIGELVAERAPGTAPNDELELSLSRFGSGIYLIHIQTSAGLVIKRVMVL